MSRRRKNSPAGGAQQKIPVMDAFSNPLFRLGYGSQSPLEATDSPLTRMTSNYALLNSLYRSNWVVQNVVGLMVDDMLREWYSLKSASPEQCKAIQSVERTTKLRDRISTGLKWGRLYGGAAGLILIDGQDIRHVTLKSLRQDIGIVQQDVYLFSGTVAQNIAYGKPGATREEIVEAARLAGAERFILALKDGFDTYVGERGVKLSGGQKQRIAIARALATNPKVLLCDEATSALDPNTTHAILTLIKDINKKLGITVVVITHQMSVVEEICDSVAILDGGVVVEQGEVREIFANPKTAAARRLVAPNGGSAARDLSSFAPDDHVVRVTFNGSSAAKPLVASLAAEKGILVSVLSADTRDLSGQCYGSMLLKLPRDTEQAKQAAAYMRSQNGVTVEEVTGE